MSLWKEMRRVLCARFCTHMQMILHAEKDLRAQLTHTWAPYQIAECTRFARAISHTAIIIQRRQTRTNVTVLTVCVAFHGNQNQTRKHNRANEGTYISVIMEYEMRNDILGKKKKKNNLRLACVQLYQSRFRFAEWCARHAGWKGGNDLERRWMRSKNRRQLEWLRNTLLCHP